MAMEVDEMQQVQAMWVPSQTLSSIGEPTTAPQPNKPTKGKGKGKRRKDHRPAATEEPHADGPDHVPKMMKAHERPPPLQLILGRVRPATLQRTPLPIIWASFSNLSLIHI